MNNMSVNSHRYIYCIYTPLISSLETKMCLHLNEGLQ